MNKRGKSWHLIVTALLIVVFSFTALFGVSYTYGDTKNVYIKGAEDIRFGIDIRGGVDVTFMPADGVEATDDQIQQQIDTNLTGSIQVIRAVLPHLRAQGGHRKIPLHQPLGGRTDHDGIGRGDSLEARRHIGRVTER